MQNTIWVLGDAVIDLVPDSDGRYLKCPGGAPANVAVGASRLGGHSRFIGRVGQDPFGRYLRGVLQGEGVDTTQLFADPDHHTSTVLVDLDDCGERSFTFLVNPSADQFLTPAELPTFAAGDWLHCCSLALAREPVRGTTFAAMAAVHAAGGRVSFDPNIREDVWADPAELRPCLERALALAQVVKLSQEELHYLCGPVALEAGARQLVARFGLELLVITLGGDGLLACHQGQLHRLATQPIQPVDTTGAGDAFVAGLLAGLAQAGGLPDWSRLEPILQQAQRCGALACSAKGAMTALPTAAQLAAG